MYVTHVYLTNKKFSCHVLLIYLVVKDTTIPTTLMWMMEPLIHCNRFRFLYFLSFLKAWSITFHSWLTFALLLGACLLWMVPKSRKACLMVSPFIVFYAECLLIMQFIFGMQLVELPERVGDFTYAEIGLMKFKYPCLQLALQVSCGTKLLY